MEKIKINYCNEGQSQLYTKSHIPWTNKSNDLPLNEQWQDIVYKYNGILEYKRKFRNTGEHRLLILLVLECFIVNSVITPLGSNKSEPNYDSSTLFLVLGF